MAGIAARRHAAVQRLRSGFAGTARCGRAGRRPRRTSERPARPAGGDGERLARLEAERRIDRRHLEPRVILGARENDRRARAVSCGALPVGGGGRRYGKAHPTHSAEVVSRPQTDAVTAGEVVLDEAGGQLVRFSNIRATERGQPIEEAS